MTRPILFLAALLAIALIWSGPDLYRLASGVECPAGDLP